MAGKYDDLARSILESVGGAENVTSVAHCITRVRFKLKDESRANTPKIEALKGVIQVIQANGQYQVVVGNIVEDVYDAVLEAGGLAGRRQRRPRTKPEGEKGASWRRSSSTSSRASSSPSWDRSPPQAS